MKWPWKRSKETPASPSPPASSAPEPPQEPVPIGDVTVTVTLEPSSGAGAYRVSYSGGSTELHAYIQHVATAMLERKRFSVGYYQQEFEGSAPDKSSFLTTSSAEMRRGAIYNMLDDASLREVFQALQRTWPTQRDLEDDYKLAKARHGARAEGWEIKKLQDATRPYAEAAMMVLDKEGMLPEDKGRQEELKAAFLTEFMDVLKKKQEK